MEEAAFGLDDSLFREFTRRFSASILDGEDVYDSSDFLMQTRKIFRQIYEDAGVEIPDYFPSHIFHDYRDRQRGAWNTVWNTHREAFAPNGKDFLYCLIDKIASRQSERTYLMNLLPSECIQSNAGIAWNLHRQKLWHTPRFLWDIIDDFVLARIHFFRLEKSCYNSGRFIVNNRFGRERYETFQVFGSRRMEICHS